jgi:hypothetical protein
LRTEIMYPRHLKGLPCQMEMSMLDIFITNMFEV